MTKDNLIKANTFLIWKGPGKGVAEFRAQVQVRWMEAGNSGIQYRSVHLDKEKADAYVVKGYQADMAFGQYMGILYEERGRGFLALVGQKVVVDANGKPHEVESKEVVDDDGKKRTVGALGREPPPQPRPQDSGHEYRIVAKGNHLQQFIDGKQMLDVVDHDTKRRALEGILALQLHVGGPMFVQFKARPNSCVLPAGLTIRILIDIYA